jgi:hypothetical protein
MERLQEYYDDGDSVSTIPLNEALEHRDLLDEAIENREDSLSYEGDNISFVERFQNSHLYFDDDGNEISREEFMEQERQTQQWVFETSPLPERFVIRHPRVLLNFLRFIDSLNEINTGDETFMMDAIPYETLARMLSHKSITNPAPEFSAETDELIERLMEHANLSG